MYKFEWDRETGGILLLPDQEKVSMEPRPVYYRELNLLGFDKYWKYPQDDSAPIMWAINNNYYYYGNLIAKTLGGSLYTKPELEKEDDFFNEFFLINVELMIKKNKSLLESLVQETIQKIYNIYLQYKNKLDVIYVAFSGGKDSVVIADLVQRSLPHDDFKIVFGNTDMELPTTLECVNKFQDYCNKNCIDYIEAKSHFKAENSWKIFGPPSRRLRWCCSVHKSVPVLNKLHDLIGSTKKLRSMMITGVRGDESKARSFYDDFSIGKKIAGQYSFHPILEWSSAEVFLYIYGRNLLINEAYKLGLNRVGCLMCPNSSSRYEFLKRELFPNEVDKFCDVIVNTSKKDLNDGRNITFLETGGWKMRVTGRELNIINEKINIIEEKDGVRFILHQYNKRWIEWYKTIGSLLEVDENNYKLEYNNEWRKAFLKRISESQYEMFIENHVRTKNSIEFFSLFRAVMIKALYCIGCKLCEAECPNRYIRISPMSLKISDECIKCRACLKVINGCIYYNSIKDSGGLKKLKGLNRYLSIGVSGEWVRNYLKDQSYEPGNRRTDVMFGFLRDANVVEKRKMTSFGEFIVKQDMNTILPWALMLCNLVYTPAFGWLVKNVPFNERYTEELLDIDLGDEVTKKAKSEFWNGFKIILSSMPYGNSMNFALPEIETKTLSNGNVQLKMHSLTRGSWNVPIPEVILYSLYKFAEACGGMYQFTLTTLLNDDIEREGISPTKIFGLDRDTMIPMLNGLSANYPDYINASFSLDLDKISLRGDKKAEDVLDLI